MKPKTDIDYVIMYSELLKENSDLFEQQRIFLNAQIDSSKVLFSNFGRKKFKKKAREYLKKRGIL